MKGEQESSSGFFMAAVPLSAGCAVVVDTHTTNLQHVPNSAATQASTETNQQYSSANEQPGTALGGFQLHQPPCLTQQQLHGSQQHEQTRTLNTNATADIEQLDSESCLDFMYDIDNSSLNSLCVNRARQLKPRMRKDDVVPTQQGNRPVPQQGNRPVPQQGNRPVLRCAVHRPTNAPVVLKSISKQCNHLASRDRMRTWRTLCRSILNWPSRVNLMKVYRIFETPSMFHFVLERMQGGELFEFFIREKEVPEETCKYIMIQIFKALDTLHQSGVLHRDVKPENLMFRQKKSQGSAMDVWNSIGASTLTEGHEARERWAQEYELALIDFDTCRLVQDASLHGERIGSKQSLVGTYGYLAPEIMDGHCYSQASDLWSVGIILYVLMTGQPPVPMDRMKDLPSSRNVLQRVQAKGLNFDASPLPQFPQVRDLCMQLLQFDKHARIQSAAQCLNHPWLVTGTIMDAPLSTLSVHTSEVVDSPTLKGNLSCASDKTAVPADSSDSTPLNYFKNSSDYLNSSFEADRLQDFQPQFNVPTNGTVNEQHAAALNEQHAAALNEQHAAALNEQHAAALNELQQTPHALQLYDNSSLHHQPPQQVLHESQLDALHGQQEHSSTAVNQHTVHDPLVQHIYTECPLVNELPSTLPPSAVHMVQSADHCAHCAAAGSAAPSDFMSSTMNCSAARRYPTQDKYMGRMSEEFEGMDTALYAQPAMYNHPHFDCDTHNMGVYAEGGSCPNDYPTAPHYNNTYQPRAAQDRIPDSDFQHLCKESQWPDDYSVVQMVLDRLDGCPSELHAAAVAILLRRMIGDKADALQSRPSGQQPHCNCRQHGCQIPFYNNSRSQPPHPCNKKQMNDYQQQAVADNQYYNGGVVHSHLPTANSFRSKIMESAARAVEGTRALVHEHTTLF